VSGACIFGEAHQNYAKSATHRPFAFMDGDIEKTFGLLMQLVLFWLSIATGVFNGYIYLSHHLLLTSGAAYVVGVVKQNKSSVGLPKLQVHFSGPDMKTELLMRQYWIESFRTTCAMQIAPWSVGSEEKKGQM
jgi:hypothetical protein